jgi:hypothetical protein
MAAQHSKKRKLTPTGMKRLNSDTFFLLESEVCIGVGFIFSSELAIGTLLIRNSKLPPVLGEILQIPGKITPNE